FESHQTYVTLEYRLELQVALLLADEGDKIGESRKRRQLTRGRRPGAAADRIICWRCYRWRKRLPGRCARLRPTLPRKRGRAGVEEGGSVGRGSPEWARRRCAVTAARRGRALRRVAKRANDVLRRRQIGRISDPHEHHFGRRDRPRRLFYLGYSLEQHLPGSRQDTRGQAGRQIAPTLAFDFGE